MLVLQSAEPIARVSCATMLPVTARIFGSFVEIFGESMLTTDGDTWRRLKAVSHAAIAGRDTDRIAETTRRRYGEALDQLLALHTPEPLIDRAFDRASAGVLLDVAFGLDADALPDRFFDDFRTVLDYCAAISWRIDEPEPLLARKTRQRRAQRGGTSARTWRICLSAVRASATIGSSIDFSRTRWSPTT